MNSKKRPEIKRANKKDKDAPKEKTYLNNKKEIVKTIKNKCKCPITHLSVIG